MGAFGFTTEKSLNLTINFNSFLSTIMFKISKFKKSCGMSLKFYLRKLYINK